MLIDVYHEVEQALSDLNIQSSVAQFHGGLCGHLMHSKSSAEDWLLDFIGQRDSNNLLAKDAVSYLHSCLIKVSKELSSDSFEFKILVEADSDVHAASYILESISDWCDSFLYAFGISGLTAKGHKDVEELLYDFSEISRIDFSESGSENIDDLDLIEVIEYIKVGVLLIYDTYATANLPIDESSA